SLRGPIAFCPEAMAVYRLHKDGVWTGALAVSKLDATVRMHRVLRNLLPEDFKPQVTRAIEKNYRLIVMELLRSEIARKAKRSRRFRRHVLRPLALVLLYLLSFGPFMKITSQVESPSAMASAMGQVQE